MVRLTLLVIVIISCLFTQSLASEPEIRFVVGSVQNVNVSGVIYPAVGVAREVVIRLQMLGATPTQVRAGRVVVTKALDDTGAELKPSGEPSFIHQAAGSVGGRPDEPDVNLDFTLSGMAQAARAIRTIECRVELVIPDLDPEATLVIDNVASKCGAPIDSQSLRAADVILTVLTRQDQERRGIAVDDFHISIEPIARPFAVDDVCTTIIDPHVQLIGSEFQTRDGGPLRYHHNGYSHSSDGRGNFRVDTYRIPPMLPGDARMVCWLVTGKSLVTIPLTLKDIELPPQH